jgi:1-phosphofructokinase family hexose kinase
VIFSGSLPEGVPPDFFARLIASARACGCRTFLDTSGEALRLAVSAKPDFVKPNRDEAKALLGSPVDSPNSAVRAIERLLALGARSAAVSLGADGLLFSSGKSASVLFAPALSLQARSTVGCGDSALAGFAHAIASNSSDEEALRLAAACGAANCFADSPGAASGEAIRTYKGQIRVHTLTSGP